MLTTQWVGTVEKSWFDSLWGRFFTFQTLPDRLWDPPSLLFQVYRANLSPLSSAEVTTQHTALLPHMSSWTHRENIFIILRMDVSHNRSVLKVYLKQQGNKLCYLD
jgi:hypothetical protein